MRMMKNDRMRVRKESYRIGYRACAEAAPFYSVVRSLNTRKKGVHKMPGAERRRFARK